VLKAVTDGGSGELVPHEGEQEAIREITELRDQGKALRAIAEASRSAHEGVAGVLRAARPMISAGEAG
jgi:hypothetical protein